jgi:hypothetical protein
MMRVHAHQNASCWQAAPHVHTAAATVSAFVPALRLPVWRASVHTAMAPARCGLLWLQVKAMWAVSHPLEAQVLAPVGKQEFSKLLTIWQDVMLMHPVWSRLMGAAAAAQYDAVASGLADRFD